MSFENRAGGEVVEVLSESRELLVMRATWTRPGHREFAHSRPGMQERWEVLQGQAAFDIDGSISSLGPGASVVAGPGQRHLAGEPEMPLMAEFPEEIKGRLGAALGGPCGVHKAPAPCPWTRPVVADGQHAARAVN